MTGRLFIFNSNAMPTPANALQGAQIPFDDGFSIRISEIESAITEIEITRRQTGWLSLARSSAIRFAAVAWSPTGKIADAELLAIGRLAEVPGDLFSTTQVLRYLCAPVDIESKMLAFAKSNLDTSPQVDWLVADASRTDPQAYLAGRTRVYRVDPVSHEVSTYDEIVGDRVVDLTDLALADGERLTDKPGLYDAPTKTLRTRIVADWTQSATGEVDIGARIPRIDSLDPNVGSNIASHVVFRNPEGWTVTGGEAKTTRSGVRVVDVGSRYRLKWSNRRYRNFRVQTFGPLGEPGEYVRLNDVATSGSDENLNAIPDTITSVRPALAFFVHRVESFGLSFDYSQPRRETLHAALTCPEPPFAPSDDLDDDREEPDFEIQLADVFTDHTVDEYEERKDYFAGDLVRRVDRYFECLADHYSETFTQIRPGFERDMTNRTFWKRVFPDIPMPATLVRFFDSDRGKTLAEHVMLRMRKEALRRLRMRHVALTYRWEDAAHVRLQDSVQFLVPWGDGTLRPVIGKVFSIDRTWNGVTNPLIVIEAAVSFGRTEHVVEPVEGRSTMEVHVSGHTRSIQPVEAWRLVSSNYAAPVVQIVNPVGPQMDAVSEALRTGGKVEDCTVLKPTTIDVTLQKIQATDTLEREIDAVAVLDRSPAGILL